MKRTAREILCSACCKWGGWVCCKVTIPPAFSAAPLLICDPGEQKRITQAQPEGKDSEMTDPDISRSNEPMTGDSISESQTGDAGDTKHLKLDRPRSAPVHITVADSSTEQVSAFVFDFEDLRDSRSLCKFFGHINDPLILVDGSFLVDLSRSPNARLPSRSQLPAAAIVTLNESNVHSVKVFALSYHWGSLEHPDPHGKFLADAALLTQTYLALGPHQRVCFFADFMSMYGPSGCAKASIPTHHLAFAHQLATVVWLHDDVSACRRLGSWGTEDLLISSISDPASFSTRVLDFRLIDTTKNYTSWNQVMNDCSGRRLQRPLLSKAAYRYHLNSGFEDPDNIQGVLLEAYSRIYDTIVPSLVQLPCNDLNWTHKEYTAIAGALHDCSSLEIVDMSRNRDLHGSIDVFASVSKLHTLKLSQTGVHGNIDYFVRGRSSVLQHLDLSDTAITGGLEAFTSCANLHVLRLHGSKVMGNVKALKKLTTLRVLDLGNTMVTGSVTAFDTCRHLQVLNLHKLQVMGDVKELAQLPRLCVLDLSEAQVEGDIIHFSTATTLRELDFSHCDQICGDVVDIALLVRLENLNLSFCHRISGDIISLGTCTALTELDLSYTEVEGSVSTLARCKGLRKLHLDYTQVSGESSDIQAQLPACSASISQWKIF